MSRGALHNAIEPVLGRREPILDWMRANIALVKQRLVTDGVVLLRGFDAANAVTAQEALSLLGGDLLDDAYWSTPRTNIAGKTFSATEMPPDRTISLHSEMSYMRAWPRLLAFHSLEVADQGGATTICNLDDASGTLSDLLVPFAEKGVIYRRYYHTGIDIAWKSAFRTDDPADVEATAARVGMKFEWLPGNVLMTEHAAQGCVTAEHGRSLWFNQANLFHPAALAPKAREQLTMLLGADRLPRQSFYGDGSAIAPETIARANQVLNDLTYEMEWQPHDLVILDNMRFLHGRLPFSGGTRRLFVAMADKETERRRTPLFATRELTPAGS
jgi:hypothetical protein